MCVLCVLAPHLCVTCRYLATCEHEAAHMNLNPNLPNTHICISFFLSLFFFPSLYTLLSRSSLPFSLSHTRPLNLHEPIDWTDSITKLITASPSPIPLINIPQVPSDVSMLEILPFGWLGLARDLLNEYILLLDRIFQLLILKPLNTTPSHLSLLLLFLFHQTSSHAFIPDLFPPVCNSTLSSHLSTHPFLSYSFHSTPTAMMPLFLHILQAITKGFGQPLGPEQIPFNS